MAHPVVHWEIGARDGSKLQKFYADLFGWSVDATNPEYAMVEPGGEGGIGGGIMQVQPGMPPYVTIYVQVDSLETYLARANELGGGTVVPPMPITGVAGVSGFAMFRDPEGNVVGLLAGGA